MDDIYTFKVNGLLQQYGHHSIKPCALMPTNSTELGTLSSSDLSMYPDISAESSAFLSLTQTLGGLTYLGCVCFAYSNHSGIVGIPE